MPAWGDKDGGLRPAEIEAVVAHVRSFGEAPARRGRPPDPLGGGRSGPGQALYADSCASCHGQAGKGAEGPALNNPSLLRSATDTYLVETIRRGRRGTSMAAFGSPSTTHAALCRRGDRIDRRFHPHLGGEPMKPEDMTRREFLEARPRPDSAPSSPPPAGPGLSTPSRTRCRTTPNRDWERTYRDLWKYDSTFTFLCAPNDTHNCILNAYVRSGVMTRIGPTMRYGEATDLDGNRATHRWDPRVARRDWR